MPTARTLRAAFYAAAAIQAHKEAELHEVYGDGFKLPGRMSVEHTAELAVLIERTWGAEKACIAADLEY